MAKDARPRNQPLLTEEEVAERRHILLQGIGQFNDGYFFEAHETWEDLWYPSPWPMRQFLQGVIQVAAALVHLMRHEYPGTIRLLDAALEKLERFPEVYLGIDNTRLIAEVRRAREELETLGPERFEEWDRDGIPQIGLVDEGELGAKGEP
jgi:predicted metal-dependent hydrolase